MFDPIINGKLNKLLKGGGYSKKELKTIVPTTEIPFEVQDGMGNYTYENAELSDIAPEKTYKVLWDGVEYICVAFVFAEDAVVIGRNPMTGENGEPFTFMLIPGAGLDVYAYSDAPTHTVSIATETETITPIDQKYLPGVCLPVVELSTELANNAVLTDAESALLATAFEVGTPVVIRCAVCFSFLGSIPSPGQFVFNPLLMPVEGRSVKSFWGVIGGIDVCLAAMSEDWLCNVNENA